MLEDKKNEIKDEFEFKGSYQKKYENIKNLLQSAMNQVEKVKNAIEGLEQEERKTHYQSIPGTEGVFDGQYLIAQDGRKTEVPANYAAKSKLVYGDILKVFTDSGKQIFKQIDRVERHKIEGVLAKKEGKWYLLADTGSYRISDASAEFNKAELNDKASAFIPAQNPKVPFASLDVVFKAGLGQLDKFEHEIPKKSTKKAEDLSNDRKDDRPSIEKRAAGNKGKSIKTGSDKKIKKEDKKEEKLPKSEDISKKEFVNNLLGEDDLR